MMCQITAELMVKSLVMSSMFLQKFSVFIHVRAPTPFTHKGPTEDLRDAQKTLIVISAGYERQAKRHTIRSYEAATWMTGMSAGNF